MKYNKKVKVEKTMPNGKRKCCVNSLYGKKCNCSKSCGCKK